MSLVDFFRGLSQLSFLLVSAVTLYQWLKHRDQTRLDIALVFFMFALVIVSQFILGLVHVRSPLFDWILLMLILMQPFQLLRVARYFHPLAPGVLPVAAATLAVVGLVIGFLIPEQSLSALPPMVLALPIAYLVIVGGYASFLFIRGAMTLPGITGKRLFLASLGSGALALLFFLAFALILLGGNQMPEPARTVSTVAVQSLGIVSAWCYFFGFCPPRGLLQSWQLKEFRRFLKETIQSSLPRGTLSLLALTAQRAVGGQAAVVLWDETKKKLRVQSRDGQPIVDWEGTYADLLNQAWIEDKKGLVPFRHGDFRNLYLVPIESPWNRWGLLTVVLRYQPLFEQDDLDLLGLLTDQCAVQMDNGLLVDQLEEANRSLQDLLTAQAHQSAQLEAANKELEAFSYSVSHDLRSPLRGIDGWSLALLEDYGDRLDDTGKGYLTRVRDEAHRMAQLIDDLFQLSRLSRMDLELLEVNLSEIVRTIARRIEEANPGRHFQFIIDPELKAFCDPRLMETALTNLLDNAAKFTATRDLAVIEVGTVVTEGKREFFVRDNGVGYDPHYAEKLFGVFQRMHPASSFPGTGIGLAIVKRVIQRQGGSIRSSSAVDQGATFYFTLKESP